MRDKIIMDWWNKLSFDEQVKKKDEYFGKEVLLSDLTKMDIEEMYLFHHRKT